jgi:hypothetical protein
VSVDSNASAQQQIRHGEARGAIAARERVARMRTLAVRGLTYWKGAVAILILGAAVSVGIAESLHPVYRAECTVFAKARIHTDDRDDGAPSPDQVLRQAARLKDMLTTRGRLESAIKMFGLYPETLANKSMQDAVEEMKPHVGFRSLEGALYVISFDGPGPYTVQKVTEYLSDSLIDDYAASDVDDLRRDADFLTKEEESSLDGLEEATRALTAFLAAHPEFAIEAKQAATPFGPSQTAGIPLLPKVRAEGPADPELAALYREHNRLDSEVHGAAAFGTGAPLTLSSNKQIDDQLAQSQAEVEAAAKRVAEAQADIAAKSNLTEDHPDMRAARMAAAAAARQFHEAKVTYASVQQLKATGTLQADPMRVPPEIAEKLRQVDTQISARRGRLAKSRDSSAAADRPTNPEVRSVVELETEWQRLLRALGEARSHHDDLKVRSERSKLALSAARVKANEQMAVVDPPFRPTHPSKGGRTKAALAGLVMTLLLSVGYATARVAVDDTLLDGDDVEGLGILPVLCVVPKLAPRVRGRSKEASGDAAA